MALSGRSIVPIGRLSPLSDRFSLVPSLAYPLIPGSCRCQMCSLAIIAMMLVPKLRLFERQLRGLLGAKSVYMDTSVRREVGGQKRQGTRSGGDSVDGD